VFTVKICKSHLNLQTKQQLKMLFLEAKWLYNHIIAQHNVFNINYKLQEVKVRVKDRFECRTLCYLSSQMKQSLIKRTLDNIKGLARLKANGRKIGPLKFKSYVWSIPLKQYTNTYKLLDEKYIKIQGISQKLRVNGLDQVPEGVELANAILLQRHGDYYLAITTYLAKQTKPTPVKTVGIDFGLATQLTLSNSIAIRYAIPISTRLRKFHRKLSRQHFRSQNWYKTKLKLEKAYAKINNIKLDIKTKLVHYIQENHGVVCYQDENLKGWQRLWGGKMLSTAIGGIIRMLENKVHTPIKVDRFFPSTKTCSHCGNIREIRLDERIYVCPVCGMVMNRDFNSSVNLENEGLKQAVGTVRTEFTPVETESSTLAALEYLNNIPYVKASSIVEAGSLSALA